MLADERRREPPLGSTYDARPDVESYVSNRLGTPLLFLNYGSTIISLIFLSGGVAFFLLGLLMFGLPPVSVLPSLTPFWIWFILWGGAAVYTARQGKAKPFEFPDHYTLDEYGLYIHRPSGKDEWIDWDDARLYFLLLDRRPWTQFQRGVTLLVRGTVGYPIPSDLFDRILVEARAKGLAGNPSTYLSPKGKVTRVIVSKRGSR